MNDSGRIPGALGPNSLHIFRIGEGPFESSPMTPLLRLEPDQDEHGTVQPSHVMPYNSYRQAIVDTCEQWVSGEGDE